MTKAKVDLQNLCATGDADKFSEVQKAHKKAATVTEDMLALVVAFLRSREVEVLGAPFEADWQLAYLERVGYTAATITEDIDLFLLGSKLLVLQLRGKDCHIVDPTEVLGPHGLLGGGTWNEKALLVFCSFLGTDYIPRVKGWSAVTAKMWVERWVDEGSKEDVLTHFLDK